MVDAAKAAEILIDAHLKSILLDDIPDACKARTPAEAQEVQLAMLRHPRLRHVGWKVALTNKEVQAKYGVAEPDYGPVYGQFVHDDGHVFAAGASSVGGIECEIAVLLGKNLPASGVPYTREQCVDAVATVHPSIEIIGSRFKTRQALGRPGSGMDFAGNFAFVFGRGVTDWRKYDLASHKVAYLVDGKVEATATGGRVLDHPFNSIAWLAGKLAPRGMALKAGDWISTGAAIGPVPVAAGAEVAVDLGPLGCVACRMPKS